MRSFEVLSDYLYQLHSLGNAKKDILLIEKLAQTFGSPEKSYPTIHVAGTNGKGSVSLKIAQTLQLSGYKVGLYTSPHLHSLQERILVNREGILKDYFCEKVEELLRLGSTLEEKLTFFEVMTLICFQYFRDMKVDVAVIEAGIGGEFDFTNFISPCLSIITSVGWDHMDLLGDTLEKIAHQKAGIIKPLTPVVIGPRARFSSIYDRAKALQAPLFSVEEEFSFFDEENTAIAKLGLQKIAPQFSLLPEVIEKGTSVRPSCRFEKIGKIIFDVAHNEDGLKMLIKAVEAHFPEISFNVLMGMAKDKDLKKCLSLLASRAKTVHLVDLPSNRGAKKEELAQILRDQGYQNFKTHPSITEGMQRAQKEAELLVVCGSFYLMNQAKSALPVEAQLVADPHGI